MTRRMQERTLFDPPRRARRVPRSPAAPLELVRVAIAGDYCTMFGSVRQRFILEACGSPATVMLGCLSCRQPLATLQQLHAHLEARPEQAHVIARQCGEHGWEALR